MSGIKLSLSFLFALSLVACDDSAPKPTPDAGADETKDIRAREELVPAVPETH